MRSVGFQLPSFDSKKKTKPFAAAKRPSWADLLINQPLSSGIVTRQARSKARSVGWYWSALAVGAPWLTGGFTGTVFHHVFHPSSVKRCHIDFWSSMYNVATNKTCSVETVNFVILITIKYHYLLAVDRNVQRLIHCPPIYLQTSKRQPKKKSCLYFDHPPENSHWMIEPWAALYSTTIKRCQY